jgi:hypothetical protein
METTSAKNSVEQKLIETLASGSDITSITCSYTESGKKERATSTVQVTWDQILKYVAPALLNECTEQEFSDKVRLCVHHALKISDYSTLVIPHVALDGIKIQLRALGQMAPGTKRRAVADRQNYWKLTELGEHRLISSLAIAKKPNL